MALRARMAAGATAVPTASAGAADASPSREAAAATSATVARKAHDFRTPHPTAAYERFSELVHPLESNLDPAAIARLPSADAVRAFLRILHATLAIDVSILVMTFVYVERVLARNGWRLLPETWRRLVLAGLLAAAKLLFDEIVWNVDLTAAFPAWKLGDVNELELCFCTAMHYSLHVRSSTWAHHYFAATSLVRSARRRRHRPSVASQPARHQAARTVVSSVGHGSTRATLETAATQVPSSSPPAQH